MARRNKKKLETRIVPMFLVGLVVMGVTFALCWVWLDCRCDAVGEQLESLERANAELNRTLLHEQCRWTRVKAPASIDEALIRHRVSMAWPRRDQIVWLRETDVSGESMPALHVVATGPAGNRVSRNE